MKSIKNITENQRLVFTISNIHNDRTASIEIAGTHAHRTDIIGRAIKKLFIEGQLEGLFECGRFDISAKIVDETPEQTENRKKDFIKYNTLTA